jgi:hypothetical protein
VAQKSPPQAWFRAAIVPYLSSRKFWNSRRVAAEYDTDWVVLSSLSVCQPMTFALSR